MNPGRFAGMTRRTLFLTAGALVAATAIFFLTRPYWTANNAAAQSRQTVRTVPVVTAVAEKKNVPVRVEALGNVTTIASVAIKSRVDSVITGVHFADGALVKAGDLLFTLDSRQTEAEIKRVQAVIDGAQAQLEQAERDVQRYTELVAKNATTVVRKSVV